MRFWHLLKLWDHWSNVRWGADAKKPKKANTQQKSWQRWVTCTSWQDQKRYPDRGSPKISPPNVLFWLQIDIWNCLSYASSKGKLTTYSNNPEEERLPVFQPSPGALRQKPNSVDLQNHVNSNLPAQVVGCDTCFIRNLNTMWQSTQGAIRAAGDKKRQLYWTNNI